MSTDPSSISRHDDGQSPNGHAKDTEASSGKSSGASLFSLLLSSLGRSSSNVRATLEDALRADAATGDSSFSDEERDMLLRLLRYGGLRVDDVMVPRADIIAADENETVADVIRMFVDAGVSRIPLFSETLDDPRGVLHIKDLLGFLVAEAEAAGLKPGVGDVAVAFDLPSMRGRALDLAGVDLNRSIGSLKVRRDVLFVPPSMPAMGLLIRMQTTRSHMALVVDEYGGTDGLVTIEDLVEEIVGDIEDEHDEDEDAHILEDPKLGLVASARTPVEDLEAHLELKLLTEENEDDIDTIGGLVFSLIARVPNRGEIIPHPSGIEFEVLDADPRRIKKLKVHRTPAVRETEPTFE
ncbi:MAG: transporter associated domain-containing protein [Pseudomonadota bacterium]